MPILSMTVTPPPGYLVQRCAGCGARHTISFDRAAQKARTGPVALSVGDTLSIRVDGAEPVIVRFEVGDFPDFGRVTATQLAAKLNATIAGLQASEDAGGLLIESASTGEQSRLEIVGGTACSALGFVPDRADPCVSRPLLGIGSRDGSLQDSNVIALRRCSDCGANECLVRTFEATAEDLDGTYFKEHRRSVNSLAEYCKARGWCHPGVAKDQIAETAVPHDLDPEFPGRPSRPMQRARTSAQPAAAHLPGGMP
jgi:hypothetical protein